MTGNYLIFPEEMMMMSSQTRHFFLLAIGVVIPEKPALPYWTRKWDGKIKDVPQSMRAYVWFLNFTHHDTGKKVFMKGTTVLIR